MLTVFLTAAVGLAGSLVCERLLLQPASARRAKPLCCLALHAGLWCMVHGLFVLVTGRPIFSMAIVLAVFVTLILVNTAKYTSLKEPFLFQDYDYFLDTIRCPRLFLPFLGIRAFCLAAMAFMAALAGFLLEEPPATRWQLSGQGGAGCLLVLTGILLLVCSPKPRVLYRPTRDLERCGFLVFLFLYARAQKAFPVVNSPYAELVTQLQNTHQPASMQTEPCASKTVQPALSSPASRVPFRKLPHTLPHLVAVQSESFFDPRPLWNGIRPELLSELDLLQQESSLHGNLSVPARGGNTIRTEFAFLSGLSEDTLGIHRFNPYRALAHGWQVAALPAFLKTLGYRTVCLHPYLGSFYFRSKIFPELGFESFEDISFFRHASHDGAYVADAALTTRLAEYLEQAAQPTFLMAITMENHGPLHLERADPSCAATFYTEQLPEHCEELTIYLRHLCNANAMIGALRTACTLLSHPVSLCWYGDHIPIMPQVYATFGDPEGTVPYTCWNSWDRALADNSSTGRHAHELGLAWLTYAGVIPHTAG